MTPSEYRKYVEKMYSKRIVTPKRRRSPSLRRRSSGKGLSAATYARAAKYDALQRASKKAVAFKIGKLARGKAKRNSSASKIQAQGRMFVDRRRASKAASRADAAAASRAASSADAAAAARAASSAADAAKRRSLPWRRAARVAENGGGFNVQNDEFRTFERYAEKIAKDLETNEPVEFVEVEASIEGGMRRRRKNRKSRGKKRSKSRSTGKRRSKSGSKSRGKRRSKSRSKGKRKMRGGRDSY